MGGFLALLVAAIFASGLAAEPLSAPEQKMLRGLMTKCDDGIGQACYEYGQALLNLDAIHNQAKAIRYIHRACAMTYQPACGHPTDGKPADMAEQCRQVASTLKFAPGSPGNVRGLRITEIAQDSPLAKADLKPGDVIVEINGKPLAAAEQVGAALADGIVKFVVMRNQRPKTISVKCP